MFFSTSVSWAVAGSTSKHHTQLRPLTSQPSSAGQRRAHVGDEQRTTIGAEIRTVRAMPQPAKVHRPTIIALARLIDEAELLDALLQRAVGLEQDHVARRPARRVDRFRRARHVAGPRCDGDGIEMLDPRNAVA